MNSKKDSFRLKREQLVEYMKTRGAVRGKIVEKAFLEVKRELFVKQGAEEEAYLDEALPIGFGQTISQPSTIAIMLELLEAHDGMKILEVGSGCGYVCALLANIVGEKGSVFGIELNKELAEISKKNLARQESRNTEIICGDGCNGLAENAPFDRIIVSAACPFVPKKLFDQLAEGGRIVSPVGDSFTQMMHIFSKVNGKPVKKQYEEGYFAFVPLRCRELGW